MNFISMNIKQLVDNEGIGQDAFGVLFGLNRGAIGSYISGKATPKIELLQKISEKYQISIDDLINTDISGGIKQLIREPETETGYENIAEIVPILPICAQGGTLDEFTVQIKNDGDDLERIVSPIKGADFAITVSGNSMEPEFPPGAKILIKKINEKAFIEWGKVFVLDTVNGVVLKQIKPSVNENCLKCVSINKDYDPFEVNMGDVNGIYRILMVMSLK